MTQLNQRFARRNAKAAPPPPITVSSIFAPTDTPAIPITDPQSVEVGLKFRSDIDGLIVGVRFFKGGPANGGTHLGHLWASDGTRLGEVTFTNERESGWQEAGFQTPIPITANTTYVVSYFAPQGNYAATPGQFESSGVDPAPLRALRDGDDGGNGVFLHSSTGGFPIQTSNSTNYWVDVVFADPTLSPPQVLSTNPPHGMRSVATSINPTITFSEPLDPMTVNTSTVQIINTSNNPIPFTISYVEGSFTITLDPLQGVVGGHVFSVVLKGGLNEPHITDVTGTPLPADYIFSFRYEASLILAEVAMHGDLVTADADFIAMRPGKLLAPLLGINDESSVRFYAYLLADNTREPGAGIVNQTIQYCVAADFIRPRAPLRPRPSIPAPHKRLPTRRLRFV